MEPTKQESKRVHPYKNANGKKKSKQEKGAILIDPLPMKPAKQLAELKDKVTADVSKEQVLSQPQVEVLEESEIQSPSLPFTEGTSTLHYSSLEEILDSVPKTHPCPIHHVSMTEHTSKKKM